MTRLDIDTFGEVVDNFLKDNEVQMLIALPEGSMDAQVKDNVKAGSVMQFYIMLHGMKAIFDNMFQEMAFDPMNKEQLLDSMLELVKKDVLKEGDE